VDESGRLHFSQEIAKVPPEKREQARRGARERRKQDLLQRYGRSPSNEARRSTLRAPTVMRIPFEQHGSRMRVEALLNGRVRAPFLIDTGASGVSLPKFVAQQRGLEITDATPRVRVKTANGVVSEPVVRLQSVQLGRAKVVELQAAVSSSMEVGLLGGTFFNNYVYPVDAAAGVISLKPNLRIRAGLSQVQWQGRFDSLREPLKRLDTHLEQGRFRDAGRVRQLEVHRAKLRSSLDKLEREANSARVPRGWRD
jgi:clan AA aspartic protease (TIGR02281 family)